MADWDVAIVGLGIKNVDHLTRETERVLRGCRAVFVVDTGLATRALLEGLGCEVVELYGEAYQDEANRIGGYRHMAVRVVEAALDGGPVAFAMHGHPTVFSYPAFLIRDLCDALGLRARVFPGISAIDCVLAALVVDPSESGLQMYEATELLLRARPLQPDVPALIWQVGTVETRLHSARPSRPERFHGLTAHLTRFWPPEHEVAAVFASPYPLVPTSILRFALGALPAQAPALHAGFTLWVPGLGGRPIVDEALFARLDSVEHLRAITR